MIKEIRLKNWKSFKNVTFKPEGINILIGANVSGKTNFGSFGIDAEIGKKRF